MTMNRSILIFLIFPFSLQVLSQTKMIINKVNGTDSLWLSDIKSITFKTYLPDTAQGRLVAWYPFNGNANDSSGNGNDGINNAATLTTDRFGNNNNAYLFNGNASISIPELFPASCAAFTFAVWVMKDFVDINTHQILYKGLDQGEASLCITNLNNYAVVGFGVNLETGTYGAQNWYFVNYPDTLKTKTYYFLVGRYIRGQQIEFLINGKLIGSSAVPNLPLAKWPTHSYSAIGTHPTFPTTYYWNGVIDDIRVYNRALSDEEVQSLYHEGGWALK
jgi:hypothetical protein